MDAVILLLLLLHILSSHHNTSSPHKTDCKVFTENFVKCLVGKGTSTSSYSSWNKDTKHREQAKILGIMESIWPENNGPLPWRLTKRQRELLDKRMSTVVWPHYMERLYYKGKQIRCCSSNAHLYNTIFSLQVVRFGTVQTGCGSQEENFV